MYASNVSVYCELYLLTNFFNENSFHEGPTPPTSTSTTPTPPDECLDDEYQCRSPDASTPGKCIKKVTQFFHCIRAFYFLKLIYCRIRFHEIFTTFIFYF